VEVLHFIGAKDGFIAGQFQRHFLVLGLEGGLLGGGAAILMFGLAGFVARLSRGTAGGDQAASLFGTFAMGIEGYAAIVAQIALIALVTALTSRHTVNTTLRSVE
jgi:cell division transport system permease protein